MTGHNIRALALATFAASGLLLTGCSDERTAEESSASISLKELSAIDKACASAEKSIGTHAEAIRQAILDKKQNCREVAENISDLGATWVLLWYGEDGLKHRTNGIVEEKLISEQWSLQLIGRHAAEFVIELKDLEDVLARETDCPGLSVSPNSEHQGRKSDTTAGLEVKDALQKQVLTELASVIGAEAATALAIHLGIIGTSAGFSWSTFGVSIGVGLIVDVLVRWAVDPAEELTQQLNDALDKAAQEQSDAYRKAMQQHLEMRRTHWVQEIQQHH